MHWVTLEYEVVLSAWQASIQSWRVTMGNNLAATETFCKNDVLRGQKSSGSEHNGFW